MMHNNFGDQYYGPGFGPDIIPMFKVTAAFGFFAIIALVALALKGIALWHAGRRGEKWWFIAILVINTLGILELVYLIFFAKVWFKDLTKKSEPVVDAPKAPSEENK